CKTGYTNTGSASRVVCEDTCTARNGGCDRNAPCTHDRRTNAVVCTCKAGYTNVGSATNVVCKDIYTVNDGGRDRNAGCAHDKVTVRPACKCKSGKEHIACEDVKTQIQKTNNFSQMV
ncbi:unnamed protein product, partial [Rotaria magnacalcarata]